MGNVLLIRALGNLEPSYQKKLRKKPSTKNTLPRKAILQIGRKDEELSRQARAKRVQHH